MKITNDKNKINEFLNSRYIEAIFPSKDKAAEMMESGKQLVFYWGIDPTGPDVHLGHTTNIYVMKKLAEMGHKAIMLIGDFTAMIGDPTDKEATRKLLTEKDVKENMKTYINQISKILPKNSFETKHNSRWYKKMGVKNWLELSALVTQQQMIGRDMFQERIKKDKPISMQEFVYPLLQGYDSVAMDVDGEVCGNDQTFNALVGRDLLKRLKSKEKIVITTRLLEDAVTDKKIMNKSEGRYIAINQEPGDMFGRVMAMPDSAVVPLFAYTTEVSDETVADIKSRLGTGENPMTIKKELALELVKIYHGEKEAQKAKENFENVFSEKKIPEHIEEFEGHNMKVIDFIVKAGGANSTTTAKALVDQGGISINGRTIERWDKTLSSGDIVKIGSHRFAKVK